MGGLWMTEGPKSTDRRPGSVRSDRIERAGPAGPTVCSAQVSDPVAGLDRSPGLAAGGRAASDRAGPLETWRSRPRRGRRPAPNRGTANGGPGSGAGASSHGKTDPLSEPAPVGDPAGRCRPDPAARIGPAGSGAGAPSYRRTGTDRAGNGRGLGTWRASLATCPLSVRVRVRGGRLRCRSKSRPTPGVRFAGSGAAGRWRRISPSLR